MVAFKTACRIQADSRCNLLKVMLSAEALHSTTSLFSSDLSDEELMDNVKSMGAIPNELLNCKTTKKYMLKILRHDVILNDAIKLDYSTDKLQTEVIIMGGRQDTFVTEINLQEWKKYCLIFGKTYMFNGDYFYYNYDNLTFKKMMHNELEITLYNNLQSGLK